jgi:hypothetical protein
MDASVLKSFFLGTASAADLGAAAAEMWRWTSSDVRRLLWVEFDEEFNVSIEHLVKLADAVLDDALPAEALAGIAFGLIADDHFLWDTDTPEGDRIGETLYDWSTPEINYPLTKGNMSKFRHLLLTGENTFVRADLRA